MTKKIVLRVELRHQEQWYFRLVHPSNGQVLMTSETYRTRWGARRAATKLATLNNFLYREV